MRKLKLTVESLQVESFHSEPPPPERGTVAGYDWTEYADESCFGTCDGMCTRDASCQGQCGTGASCYGTCYNSCNGTCNCTVGCTGYTVCDCQTIETCPGASICT
ncbi:hypothetical protein [Longimicrobium sp.]|uniref:hypothetical protein n=1 Tax=Longimicrobium sp. TaxID=2029185 RepID=UPI003B3A0290